MGGACCHRWLWCERLEEIYSGALGWADAIRLFEFRWLGDGIMSIWPKASSIRVANSLKAHSVIALALGGLIYILALTGTLSVFNHEIQRWEQPDAPEMTFIAPEAAAAAAEAVFKSEETPTTHLYINFPQPD